jgi:hypothetical protein
MNSKATRTAILVMAMTAIAASTPVTGYHNTPTAVVVAPTGLDENSLTTTDWTQSSGTGVSVIVCESNGPDDPRLPTDTGQNGNGGLCTTGRNVGTMATADVPDEQSEAASAGYTKVDVCSATTVNRAINAGFTPGGEAAGFTFDNADVNPACAGYEVPVSSLTGATTAEHGWTAEVGIFSCLIPVPGDASTALPNVINDYALYYDELYAWWSYDGSDNAGFHGHVSMFLSASRSVAGSSLSGSAVVTDVDLSALDFTTGTDDISDDSTVAGHSGGSALVTDNTTNNCGASPSEAPSGGPGPVMRLSEDLFA